MGRVSFDEITPHVKAAAEQFGVPEDLIWNVIRAENTGSVDGAKKATSASSTAVSPKGARGIMQVTPIAYKDVVQAGLVPGGLDLTALSIPDQINIGAAYISRLMKHSSKPEEIYAMYNFGPKARFKMDQLPQETSDYVNKATGGTKVAQSSSSSGTVADPNELINALLQSNQTAANNMQAAGTRVQSYNQRGVAQLEAGIAGQQGVIDAALALKQSQAQLVYKNEIAAQNLQKILGLNQDRPDNVLVQGIADSNAANADYAVQRAEYDKLASTDLLSDPLGYIVAQLKLPSAAARVNAAADKGANAEKLISGRLELLRAAKSNITAQTADETLRINLELAQTEANAANVKLSTEKAKIFSQLAANEMQQLNVANAIGDNTRQTLTAIASIEERQANRALVDEQRALILGQKKATAEEDARLNERLRIVSHTIGLAEPMTIQRLRALAPGKVKDTWLNAALSGQFGGDLQESVAFLKDNGSRQGMVQGGNAGMAGTAKKLEEAATEMEGVVSQDVFKKTGKVLKPGEATKGAYDTYETMIVSAVGSPTMAVDMAHSRWDKTYNPYKPEFFMFNKAVDVTPQLAFMKSNVLKKAIDSLAESGVVGENITAEQTQLALSAIERQVADGKLHPATAAADISTYMKAATAYNRSLSKYEQFALPAPNRYYFTLGGRYPKKVDLLNATSVENALVRRMRIQQSSDNLPAEELFRATGNVGGISLDVLNLRGDR